MAAAEPVEVPTLSEEILEHLEIFVNAEKEEKAIRKTLNAVVAPKRGAQASVLSLICGEKRERGGVFELDGQRYSYMVSADEADPDANDKRASLKESSVPKQYHAEILLAMKKKRRTTDHLHVIKL